MRAVTMAMVALLSACGGAPECAPGQRYVDADGDGAGSGPRVTECVEGARYVTFADDCDDTDPAISPAATEVCDGIDNDCNGVIDEGVASRIWYDDADGDGFGDPATFERLCEPPAGWVQLGSDCDDADAARNPGADDVCGDGIDQDCSGADRSCGVVPTCLELRYLDPYAASGVHPIVVGDETVDVYCDMETDGGGWTLVASTLGEPLADEAGGYTAELRTLSPTVAHRGVWDGLRPWVSEAHDLRFACRADLGDPVMTVDLTLYDVPWYHVVTTGLDRDSCFSDNSGAGDLDPPPARRNNLTGETLPLGDQWSRGYLEGEDFCADSRDFTVDFDTRGMDAAAPDGTDWGEDDGVALCGSTIGHDRAAWFIFVR